MDEGLADIDFSDSGSYFGSSLANADLSSGDDSYWSDFWGGLNKFISSNTAKNLLNFGSGLYGLYEADKMKDIAKDALKAGDPFGAYRKQYGDQLLALMADPSKVKDLPGYQFQFDQGAEAVQRKMGSKGYAGSGNLGIALTEYGQNFASDYFNREATRLATLAGANISPNLSPGVSGYASGIDTASQALASLGYASVYAGGASQGTPGATGGGSRPNSAGGEAAAITGVVGAGLKAGGSLAGLAGATEVGKTLSNIGSNVGTAGQVLAGIDKGGVAGYGQAAAGAGKLAGNLGLISQGDISPVVTTAGKPSTGVSSSVAKPIEGGITDTSGQGILSSVGNAASIYSGLKEGGAAGYGKAAGGAASLAGYDIPALGYIGAAQKVANGDVIGGAYEAAIQYSGPVGQIMNAVANAFNASKDRRSAASGAWWDEFVKTSGVVSVFPRAQIYQLPDGTVFQASGEFIKRIGNAMLNKDEAGLQSAVQDMFANTKDVSKLVPSKYFKYPIKKPGG